MPAYNKTRVLPEYVTCAIIVMNMLEGSCVEDVDSKAVSNSWRITIVTRVNNNNSVIIMSPSLTASLPLLSCPA